MTAWVAKQADLRVQLSGVFRITGVAPIRLVAIRKDKVGRRFAELEWDGDTYKLYPDDEFEITVNAKVDPAA